MKQNLQIAIDGPVAAGKGTIAKKLAEKIYARYVDSGAMYRAVALLGIRHNIVLDNPVELISKLQEIKLHLMPSDNSPSFDVYLGDENVENSIRTPEISKGSSIVAQYPEIRSHLVEIQKRVAEKYNVIMEGRDIGTIVLPTANIKIFLTANQKTRTKRRQDQMALQKIYEPFDKVLKDIIERDNRDMSRKSSPLVKADDAVEVDTSNMSIDQVVDTIIQIIAKKNDQS